MDESSKQRLLAEFESYLDELPEGATEAAFAGAAGDDPHAREVDLYTLFTELAGLKNEVQRESRQLKRALDAFQQAFAALQEQGAQMGRELQAGRSQHQAAVEQAERTLLLELIDLRDRLDRACIAATVHRPGAVARFLARRQGALLQDLGAGLAITLRRLDQTLDAHGVKPIAAMRENIDPHRMRVASVRVDPELPDGIVVEEIRCGYERGDTVLRLAEVVANKWTA